MSPAEADSSPTTTSLAERRAGSKSVKVLMGVVSKVSVSTATSAFLMRAYAGESRDIAAWACA